MSWWSRVQDRLRGAGKPPMSAGAPEPAPAPPHLSNMAPVERFGMCPVCTGMLRRVRRIDPLTRKFAEVPSWRLDIGPETGEPDRPWRVAALADPTVAMMDPPGFSPADIAFVYLLCANGHIFPFSAPLRPGQSGINAGASDYAIDRWRMVALAGPPASGKTYLVIRTLLQSLVDPLGQADLEREQVTERALSPLEELPLKARRDWYNAMLDKGDAMPGTNIIDGTPFGLLERAFFPVVDAVKKLITDNVVDGGARASSWGKRGRQPLVMRTSFGRRTTWTGVIDMPGEAFRDEHAERDEVRHLGFYDAVVWVIDPAIAAAADPWLDLPGRAALIGSMRPDSLGGRTEGEVRRERNDIQLRVGRGLSVNRAAANPRGQLSTYVAIGKADLLRRALKSRNLIDLGAPGTVLTGGEKFLHGAALMYARETIQCDPTATEVLARIYGAADSSTQWRETVARQVASSILAAYSDHDRFWNLVEDGSSVDLVRLGGPGAEIDLTIAVPTIGQHLAEWNNTTSPANLLIRDLVMSVVGCGLAYGLGYSDASYRLLLRKSHETRFFVCSALGEVPVATDDTKIQPLDAGARFPEVTERSAGLTQLLLAMLGGAQA